MRWHILNEIFNLFGMNNTLGVLFNNSGNDDDFSMVKITDKDKTKYVVIVKTPGIEKKDLNIKFINTGEYPILSVSGKTKTPFGTYSIDIGANIYLKDKVEPSQDGYMYENGILYFYLETSIPKPISPDVGGMDSSDFYA